MIASQNSVLLPIVCPLTECMSTDEFAVACRPVDQGVGVTVAELVAGG